MKGVISVNIRVGSRDTHQMIYALENTSGFYLSESALKDLSLLPPNFSTLTSQQNEAISKQRKASRRCSQRMTVPPEPASIPFTPMEKNTPWLEQWMLEHFRYSTFNVCLHQPLQFKKRRPLDITFILGTTSTLAYTPIPVSHHWKKWVDQDVTSLNQCP